MGLLDGLYAAGGAAGGYSSPYGMPPYGMPPPLQKPKSWWETLFAASDKNNDGKADRNSMAMKAAGFNPFQQPQGGSEVQMPGPVVSVQPQPRPAPFFAQMPLASQVMMMGRPPRPFGYGR